MGREADELVDVDLFEAFPDNPNDPLADGVAALSASLEQVGRRQRRHDMQVQRYDVLDRRSGEWALRVWHPTNSPLVEDGRVTALVHQVQDITPSGDDLHRALMSYRDLLGSGEP